MNKPKRVQIVNRTPKPAPIGGLFDDRFVYVPAVKTNVAETFRRIREQQKKGQTL